VSIIEEKPSETPEEVIKRLADLSEIEYEKVRVEEAKKLGFRVTELDKYVNNERPSEDEYKNDVVTEDAAYSEKVDGIEILSEIEAIINKHMILPVGTLPAIALWIVATYVYNSFRVFPKLGVISPEKRCGKSTLLDILSGLCGRSLLASNISPSAIFRSIDLWQPTLIIDEADTFLANRNDDIVGILNSGHTKTAAFVIRSEGDDHIPKKFSTWAPMAFASIKGLAGTIMDRSVVIQLRRKMIDEKVIRIPVDFKEQQSVLRQKITRYAQDHAVSLKLNPIEPPETTNDRAIDNWLPLFTLAYAIGGDWPNKANESYAVLNSIEDTQTAAVMLLEDIKYIFESTKKEKIFSADLVQDLISLEERPWCEWKRGKPMTQNSLAKILSTFNIHSKDIRIGSVKRGYEFSYFEDAISRYVPILSQPPKQSATPLQISSNAGCSDYESATNRDDVAFQKQLKGSPDTACSTVALKIQDRESRTLDTSEQTII